VSWASFNFLGPYRLLNVVNMGQTSIMWRAHNDELRQFFAVKTLQEKFLKDREHVRYLRWEYSVGQKLDHERIIQFHGHGKDRGTTYVAMEWFSASNMKQFARMGLDRVGYLIPKVAVQAAEAIAYFNDQGWIHRDVKPENFLVSQAGDVKLIDFALAVRPAKGLGKLFSTKGKVQGTRSYMSPEQIRGAPLDSRADLYSLACSLFELVVGRPPYTGASGDDLLAKHLKAAAPSIEAYNKNLTPEFSQLIRRTLSKKRENRPDSTKEFLGELRGIRIFKRDMQPPEQEITEEPPKGE
jgi:serine/threonine protein kinase